MIPRHIYTFWEPKSSMPAYLRLCMKTWEINAPDFEVTILNHSNIEPILIKAKYPIDRFYKLSLPHQKDAIMAAVLSEDGGIFMDVDTLILNDFEPILKNLQQTEVMLFSTHLAFMAARPDATILPLWVTQIKEKLLNTDPNKFADAKWNFVGNSITNPLFYNSPAKFVTRLNKNNYAFTPESLHFANRGIPRHQYQLFWFEHHKQNAPYYPNQFLIALHNSWTPDWYKKLTEDEVLDGDYLLSKTLRNVLNKNHKTLNTNKLPVKINKPLRKYFGLKPAIMYQKFKWAFK